MHRKKEIKPPAWAARFLEWYCRPELLEDLQGDLNEYFDRNVRSKGARRARWIYILDVFKFMRLYTLRKPQFLNLFIQWLMIGSYIKTSGRSILRNKLFSSINIFGLSVSMSVGLLIMAMVSDLSSYDNFHKKKERIYRVNTRDQRNGEASTELASTSVKAGKKIAETISSVEAITFMRRGLGSDATAGQTTVPIFGLWADQAFFKIFTFPFRYGDPATALKEPYSLVLTESTAKKIFGRTDVLGQSLKFDTANYIVTGILENIPQSSHLQFEALGSFATVELAKPDTDGDFFAWENIYMTYLYVLLPENGNAETVQSSLDKLSAAENAGLENRRIELWLHALKDIPFTGGLSNEIGSTFNKTALLVLSGLALVVILSACFNYTNLSIARSFRRSREVGIRKVIGALKSHVLMQFMAESVMIALLALVLSFLLFLFLRTQLRSMHEFISQRFTLDLSPSLVLWSIVLAIGVGIVSGFLPALFFSRLNASRVLKDISSVKLFRHVSLRKALIVVQYTFSLIFISSTFVGYSQYKSFLTFDLGFNTKNIVNIRLDGTNGAAVVKELSELPEVEGISRSLLVTSLGSLYGDQLKYKNDSSEVWMNMIDEHYLPLHGHKLLAGGNFNSRPAGADEREVIVNEQVLKRFDIGKRDPEKALGEVVTVGNAKLTIVGVVRDFHYGTLEDEIKPIILRHSVDESYGFINVKIQSRDWPATFATLEKIWKKIDKVHPLQARFYDDQIEEAYSQFLVMIKVIGFLSFLAVCISSMGLFGMVVFTTETRLKEISIRKVLGASEGKLVVLLSRGFITLLGVASVVALPTVYFFFDKVVLVKFAYHQPIGWTALLSGVMIVMAIACLMIGSQTLKVARTNPAEVLKNE